jgi:hypothetical protein
MTSSAEIMAAALLGRQVTDVSDLPKVTTPAGTSTSAYGIATTIMAEALGRQDAPIPGTRSVLPINPFERPFERPGAEQSQYRAGTRPGGQLRRPTIPQAAQRARGTNSWGSAPGQLGGVKPRPA